ncbi:MAG: pyridoxal-phosphate dependent enzyme [Candidatus Njordarchaeales archaeon]
MSIGYDAFCVSCGWRTDDPLLYKCQRCGGILQIRINVEFSDDRIIRHDYSMWRYRAFYPYITEKSIISLGEGLTPLIRFRANTYLKLEYVNPTGSFKDRGSSALISAVKDRIKPGDFIAEDSSGNAGASIAAYAAFAGIRARIYVSEKVSGRKFEQIRAYGAEIVKVSGPRIRVTEEAMKPERNKVYIGHVYHPVFRDGIRTLVYELYEQVGRNGLGTIFLPVSAGTLLLGIIEGFTHLRESGIIEDIPPIVACQAEKVSPLYHSLKGLKYEPPEKVESIADALVSTNPPLLKLMVKRMKEIGGDAVIVNDSEILSAYKELASKGIYVEPSSAVAYAGYKKYRNKTGNSIIILTGSGLKTSLLA